MDTHGNTMDFSWSIPWIYHGYLIIDHGFVISTMKNPWNSHGFSMYFPWSIEGISSWFFEYGHRKTWVFHGSDHGVYWNNHGFPMSLPCSGFPQSGKKSGKKIFFQDHGKVMEFCYKSVKMSFFEEVRENQSWSGNFLFYILIFYFYFENFHP